MSINHNSYEQILQKITGNDECQCVAAITKTAYTF